MDAGKLWMLRDFIGANKVLFKIPVYQRNYDWSESNCNRLLDDVRNIIDTEEKHFLGTIVFMAVNGGGFKLHEYIIIDGQQRLTTMMLLLKAVSDVAKEYGDYCEAEIQNTYLHNQYCDEEFKVKLKPIKSDNDQFLALLKDDFDSLDEESHIFKNYHTCKNAIEKWVKSGIEFSQIMSALEKLEIVQIVLTKGEDDPQIIFESINSTGLELSNADLIRNFLLMNAENQEELYEKYWIVIEKKLKRGNDYSNLNLFFLNYIIYKTNAPVNIDRLYTSFVKLFKDSGFTQESCLQDLKYYADIFDDFVYETDEYSPRVRKALSGLRKLKQTTCYPFLLHVFNDYKNIDNPVIDIATLEKIVELILAYHIRRLACGVPSNTLRGLYIYLYSRVFKVASNKKKYYEAINKFLWTVTSKDAIPSGAEFETALLSANIYRINALCKYLLSEIENGDGKETLNVDSLTVEHIMPQTLNADWTHISEEEHEVYLHTLGNLSVTGYNSELSNKSFADKKKIIEENSKAVVLNRDVCDKEEWNVHCIIERGKRLAKIVLERFDIERVVDDSIEFEYLETINFENLNMVTGKKLVAFKFEGETYRQNRYALMLWDVIKLLDKAVPGKLDELADNNFSFSTFANGHVHISKDNSDMRWPWEFRDGIYFEANLSAASIMRFIEALLKEYGFNTDNFCVMVVAEESEDDEE